MIELKQLVTLLELRCEVFLRKQLGRRVIGAKFDLGLFGPQAFTPSARDRRTIDVHAPCFSFGGVILHENSIAERRGRDPTT